MVSVTFETAALADVFKKANRIAPTKGTDVTRHTGFVLEVHNDTDDPYVIIRATDGDVFYMERMNVLEIEGEDTRWRVPSAVTAGIVGALPIGSGKRCTFEQEGGRIKITSGRTKASVVMIPVDGYPEWDAFDGEDLESVHGFGAKLDQIAWAVESKQILATSAVLLDGETVFGTDTRRLAVSPLSLKMDEDHILVRMSTLAPILSQVIETKAGVKDGYLCLQPNDYTQIKCLLLGLQFPAVKNFMKLETPEAVLFNRELAAEIVGRIVPVIAQDRQADLYVTVGNGEMGFFAEDESRSNSLIDFLDLPNQCQHDPFRFRFDPNNFTKAITKSPGLMITMNYNPANDKHPVRFESKGGYKCWISPRMLVKNDPQQNG